jgi:dihydroxyacetone kinase
LIDPLDAFVQALKKGESWSDATAKATKAAEDTRNLPAKVGRAAYVEQTNLANVCDPGEHIDAFKGFYPHLSKVLGE